MLERLDEAAAFFGGDSLAPWTKAGFKNTVPDKVTSSRAARGYRRDERGSRHQWRLEVIGS